MLLLASSVCGDMAISLIPLIDWIFGLWAAPKMAPHLVGLPVAMERKVALSDL
jgi:hypothetical protein